MHTEFGRSEIEQSIPERFQQMVALYPDCLAVKCKHHQLTYAELDKESNRLAHVVLEELGEGQEAVTLMLGHNEQMVIAILATLKTGKFHVPLNPSHPHARNASIVEDSQTRLVVTNNRHLALARDLAGNGVKLINIDELGSGALFDGPNIAISPDALAYIIYTSGTTGQPKGVTENHRNVLNFSMIYNSNLHVCSEDRLSVLDAFSFSGSASQLYPALLNGACSLPFDPKGDGSSKFADFLINDGITICGLGPTAFRSLVSVLDDGEKFPRLRVLAIGGDRIDMMDVESYRRYFSPNCILRCGFGSSEVKEISWFLMDKETQITGNVVPVGYGLGDIELLMLDDDGMEAGPDQVGEIAIRSRYISPGYWRRPDLNQAKLRPDPDGGDRRIYLTGDVGRMSSDGCLFHLGRKDFQVQIRGYRVEIAEVEVALLCIENVREAAVVAQKFSTDDTRLVAYVVSDRQSDLTVTALRRALSETLPDYMIPSMYVFMDTLPLNINGKLDRMALPAPDFKRPELENAYVAPRTRLERILTDIWQETLGVESVGVHDNFLDLGGNSIRGTMLINRLQAKLGIVISIAALFDAPTVAEMAVAVLQDRVLGEFL